MSKKERVGNESKREEMKELVGKLTAAGYTRKHLAWTLDVTPSTVGAWARGKSMGTNLQRATLLGMTGSPPKPDFAKSRARQAAKKEALASIKTHAAFDSAGNPVRMTVPGSPRVPKAKLPKVVDGNEESLAKNLAAKEKAAEAKVPSRAKAKAAKVAGAALLAKLEASEAKVNKTRTVAGGDRRLGRLFRGDVLREADEAKANKMKIVEACNVNDCIFPRIPESAKGFCREHFLATTQAPVVFGDSFPMPRIEPVAAAKRKAKLVAVEKAAKETQVARENAAPLSMERMQAIADKVAAEITAKLNSAQGKALLAALDSELEAKPGADLVALSRASKKTRVLGVPLKAPKKAPRKPKATPAAAPVVDAGESSRQATGAAMDALLGAGWTIAAITRSLRMPSPGPIHNWKMRVHGARPERLAELQALVGSPPPAKVARAVSGVRKAKPTAKAARTAKAKTPKAVDRRQLLLDLQAQIAALIAEG